MSRCSYTYISNIICHSLIWKKKHVSCLHIWQEISPVFLGDTFVPWVHPYIKYKGKGYRKGTTQNHWKVKVANSLGIFIATKVHWVHWVHNSSLPLAEWSHVHAHFLPDEFSPEEFLPVHWLIKVYVNTPPPHYWWYIFLHMLS